MKYRNRLLASSFALMLALGMGACGGNTSDVADSADVQTDQGNEVTQVDADAEKQAGAEEVASGKGLVSTFVGENVTDLTVTSDEEAEKAIVSLIDRMGGDKTTELGLVGKINTEDGKSYYIFQQESGGLMVYGGAAKLIVNKDGTVAGLVSSILPDVKLPHIEDITVPQEQAEKAAVDALENQGYADVKPASEYTTQSIIPIPGTDQRFQVVWVVYAEAPAGSTNDQAWLASYVSVDGEYLYSIPVTQPNSDEALGGEATGFDFAAYDQDEKTFEVKKAGKSAKVTVPVLVDKKTGEVAWLGDAERQILCVDYTEFTENQELVSPVEEDGKSFNDMDLAVYETYIRIWDFFKSINWTGPNGRGSSTLLTMDYRANGEPADNCVYMGKMNGWDAFSFGRTRENGLATDIIAHEFVHCLTYTTMTTNFYLNEPGAINEGMSDILGNVAEMILDGDEGAWIMGDKSYDGGLRSMSDPTTHSQPAYRWDVYYVPSVTKGTELNDTGGVHENSSLLNIVSYKLDQAGMSVEDQGNYWLDVAFAMVPTTDYVQMDELLPWVMEQSGYGQYVDVLKQAIEEAGYTKLEEPAEPPAGAGTIKFTYPDAESAEDGMVRIMFVSSDKSSEANTWPAAQTELVSASLPVGDYYAMAVIGSIESMQTKIYDGKGWVEYGQDSTMEEAGAPIHLEEGQIVELSTDGLV